MSAEVVPFRRLGTVVHVRNVAGDLVARVEQALAANVVTMRRTGLPLRPVSVSSWHEVNTLAGISPLRDTTRGRWPRMCEARTTFVDLAGREHDVLCTRLTGHTRRHAQGRDGRIVAVWEDPSEARP